MSCISSLTRPYGGPHIAGDPTTAGLVGNTPVLWIGEPFTPPGRGFWAKLEGANPGGLKDRPALHIIERARSRAELEPGAMIVESTSGTFGLGLAMAGIVFGHPVKLVADPGMEPLIRDLLAAYGARIEIVTTPHPEGGWQRARLDRVSEILKVNPGVTLGTALSYPFEMDTVVALSGGRLVATYYGLYNTIAGIGIAVGNLLGGALLDTTGSGPLPWIALATLGGICGCAVHRMATAGRLSTDERHITHAVLQQRRA